ncbi:MAG: YegS/Rv2252/BmrU family lipid kinase, partial [Anaerolineae bacterium]|nr:YegS/Rv2252/BmrU family lipid kinase [Anaerolineae bacterium]
MPRYKVILNPAARRGTGVQSLPRIKRLLAEQGLEFDLVCTERPWHAAELAREAAQDGYDVIVAAGGDGTVNEVINGLMTVPSNSGNDGRPALGVLCVGQGNDFAYGTGIPLDLEAACQALARGHRRRVDVGRVVGDGYPKGRYFGNGIGIGFDAVVGFEASRMTRLSGFPAYLVAVLKTVFLYYKAPLSRIEYDDQTIVQPSLMVSIMNGRRMGGGFYMAPDGEPDDGRFDLCIARE